MIAITSAQMRDFEQSIFAAGIDAETLMEQAGRGIAEAVCQFFPTPGLVVAYLGKGHNAGDALVALRHLRVAGWQISCRMFYPEIDWAVLTRKKYRELGELCPAASLPTLILDALLGLGAHGALREPIRSAVREIRELRECHAVPVVALDVPTGLDADSGEILGEAVVADLTLMIGAAKIGLLTEIAVNYVGRLAVVPFSGLMPVVSTQHRRLISPRSFPGSLPIRPHDFHKGKAGRVAVFAGSAGMEGAALMAATAALRAGAGLVTLFVPSSIHASITARATAEIMVKICDDWSTAPSSGFDAFVLGPGLGVLSTEKFAQLAELLAQLSCPGVIDADALNAIAQYSGHQLLKAQHVVTPHAGEFARLAPESQRRGREEGAIHFAEHGAAVLLLKGVRTLIAQRGTDLYHNSTGHAGMASGGMGDVLSGVIAALIGQGMSPFIAACCGAWCCGRAAEMQIAQGLQSQHSLVATDLYQSLGPALREWQRGT